MALPPKLFYPIAEIAPRWSVTPLDIVGWAIDGRISLSAVLPLSDQHPTKGHRGSDRPVRRTGPLRLERLRRRRRTEGSRRRHAGEPG